VNDALGFVRISGIRQTEGPFCVLTAMQFWKPGTIGPGSQLDRASETEDMVLPSAPMSASLPLQAQRQQLPIFKHSNAPSRVRCASAYTILQETSCYVQLRRMEFS
jgi:hypothetical protein